MELALLLSAVLGLSVILIARELLRNARAQQRLANTSLDVVLSPPWLKASRSSGAEAKPARPPAEGVWSAWYRDGVLAAHVCTHVEVMDRHLDEPVPILSAEIQIVQERWWRPAILLRKLVSGPRIDPCVLDIDAYISVETPGPPADVSLVLLLSLAHRQRRVERWLCPVEIRFAASGAAPHPGP